MCAAAAAACRYCCKACQVEHWKWHKALCKELSKPAAAAAAAASTAAAGSAVESLHFSDVLCLIPMLCLTAVVAGLVQGLTERISLLSRVLVFDLIACACVAMQCVH
jgi:hypothetical protein